MKTEINHLPKSEVQINFELTAEEFQKYFQQALEHLKGRVKMDGFRQGKVPAAMAEEKIGKENLLMEAGDLAVKAVYPTFAKENNLEPVGQPEVQITKIAKGSEFLFTVKVALLPDIELPDYKEIAGKIKSSEVSVSDKEIEETIEYLRKSRATFTDKTDGAAKKDYVKIAYQNPDINGGKEINDMFILGDAQFLPDFEENLVGMKRGDQKEFTATFPQNAPAHLAGKEGNFKVKMLAVQTMELPEINDEFAKGLGAFDSLVALKENLKEGIGLEKKETEKQRARGQILEKISDKIKFDIPEKMVEYEKDRLFEDLKNQVTSRFGISFEEYLQSVKKTEDQVKENFAKEAEKRIKNFLVLRQIGKAERIEVSQQELDEDLQKLVKNYSPEQMKKIDIEQLKEYSKGAIYNEKVFQFLEKLSNPK